jgi:hypothetical protein
VAPRSASTVMGALLAVSLGIQTHVQSAPPGGARVDPAVVPAGGAGCRHCGDMRCSPHGGACRAGHHADCRPGQCVPFCPVRPAQFGFYGTQWRRWPGSGVVPVSDLQDATPVEPPRLEVPGPDEESPRRLEEMAPEREGPASEPPEGDAAAEADGREEATAEVPTPDSQQPQPHVGVPNYFEETSSIELSPAPEPSPVAPTSASAPSASLDEVDIAPDATAEAFSAVVLPPLVRPPLAEPRPLPSMGSPRPLAQPATGDRGWRTFLRAPQAAVAPVHFAPEPAVPGAVSPGQSPAVPRAASPRGR